jgi:hypothetical protein
MKATYMDEAIAEKVNQMTKIVMASTADAWLVHLPGFTIGAGLCKCKCGYNI